MAGNKYLTLGSLLGLPTRLGLQAATQASAGAANANQIVALAANGFLDLSLFPPGTFPDVQLFPCTDATVVAGTMLNLYPVTTGSGGSAVTTETARKSDVSSSSAPKPVRGFAGGSPVGGQVAVIFDSICTFASGLVDGDLWADPATPGGYTQTRPTTSGQVEQKVGFMLTPTSFQFVTGGDTVGL